jgi:hypothetical protein
MKKFIERATDLDNLNIPKKTLDQTLTNIIEHTDIDFVSINETICKKLSKYIL